MVKYDPLGETTVYLTEENLREKLEQIFPKAKSITRNKTRGIDYVIDSHIDELPEKLTEMAYGSIETCDEDIEDEDWNVTLSIEYDGHYHFISNKQCYKDSRELGFCQFDETGWLEFILRIPYFVQLDAETCEHFFGVNLDLSDQYPQGFISKKVVLPDRFTVEGERCFKRHLLNLPDTVSHQIYCSLEDKAKKQPFYHVCSKSLWAWLTKKYDAKRRNLAELCIKDKEHYYTNLDDDLVCNLWNQLIETNHRHASLLTDNVDASNVDDLFQ